MVCQAALEAALTLVNPYPLLPLFSKAKVSSSHPVTQDKPLNICSVAMAISGQIGERERERERLFYCCRCI